MRIKLGKHVGCLKPAQKRSADQALLTYLRCGAGDPRIRGWRHRMESQETCQRRNGELRLGLLLGCTLQAGKPWTDRPSFVQCLSCV